MKRRQFGLAVIFLASAAAHAGGGVSSGGDLLGNARNPWWVKNTAKVQYCVQFDQETLSATRELVFSMIEKAIGYWRTEFSQTLVLSKNKDLLNPFLNRIGVGTQEFAKIECTGQEDLRFKIGYGTLDPAQIKMMDDVTSHIGLTIRTDYDDTQLKGRGFVFIGSDKGPHRFKKTSVLVEPWKYEMLLYLTLVHELGHVFGLPHIGEPYTLMSENFLEFVLSDPAASFFKDIKVTDSKYVPFFFFPTQYFIDCPKGLLTEGARAYLELPFGTQCLLFAIDRVNRAIHLLSMASAQSTPVPVGSMVNLDLNAEPSQAVTLVLNDRQHVFPMPQLFDRIAGPMFITKKGSATYYSASGIPKPLYLDIGMGKYTMVGVTSFGTLQVLLSGHMQLLPY